jgi:hypothetical protein
VAQLPARIADILCPALFAFVPLLPLCAAARFVSHHRINTGISATITDQHDNPAADSR